MLFLSISSLLLASLAIARPSPESTKTTNAERFKAGLAPLTPKTFNRAVEGRNLPGSVTRRKRAVPSNGPVSALSSTCAPPASAFAPSCSNGSPADTCCNTSPGGLLLLTVFWDTGAQSTGPNTSFTTHGLWPDNCDGSYEQYCDPSREVTGAQITSILQGYGETELLDYMKTYWKDYQGDDATFWEHEFNKHGTCISSLEPRCFASTAAQTTSAHSDVRSYFRRAVELYKTLPYFDWLAAEGIVPSFTQTYTLAQIQAAIQKNRGSYEVNIQCSGSVFNEVWAFYHSEGSVIDGDFVKTDRVGSASTCPATGIKWYPKYQTIPVTSAASLGLYPATVASDGTVAAYSTGAGVIGGGFWYAGSGSTITVAAVDGGFTFSESGGRICAILTNRSLSCATGLTASIFTYNTAGVVSYQGSSVFSVSAVPAGSTKITIYAAAPNTANPQQVQITLAAKP